MTAVFEPAIEAPGLGLTGKIERVSEVESGPSGVFITYRHGEDSEERIEIPASVEMKVS